jgi:hypothetical protein
LEQNAQILEPELRKTLVRALVLLRNRNLLSPTRYGRGERRKGGQRRVEEGGGRERGGRKMAGYWK